MLISIKILLFLYFINLSFSTPLISNISYFNGYANINGKFQDVKSVIFSKDSFNTQSSIGFQLVDDSNIQINITDNMVSLGMIKACTTSIYCSNYAIWNPVYIEKVIGTATEGGFIKVEGHYLNDQNALLQISNTQYILNSTYVTPNEIQFDFPTSISETIDSSQVDVAIQVRSSNFNASFKFDPPHIQTVIVDKVIPLVHVEGDSFGINKSLLKATVDGMAVEVANISNHYYISLDTSSIPDYFKIAGSKEIQISRNNVLSNIAKIKTRPVPINITTVYSETGGIVTIYGTTFSHLRFNKTLTDISISLGGIPCSDAKPILSLPDYITCKVGPVGRDKQTSDLLVKVTIDGAESINHLLFSFDIPVIHSYKQNADVIEITGERLGFGDDMEKSTIFFNHFQLKPFSIKMINDTGLQLLKYRISNRTAVGKYDGVTIQFKNIMSNPISVIIAPVITDITSPPTSGGVITITGIFLDTRDLTNITIRDPSTHNITTCKSMERITPQSITCTVEAGSGGNLEINTTMKGSISIRNTFSYQPPSIHSSSTINFFGGLITIFGDNFAQHNLSVTIGKTECADARIVSSTMLLCSIEQNNVPSPVPIENQNIKVVVNGLVGNANIFSYTQLPTKSPLDKQLRQLTWIIPIGSLVVGFIVLTTIILTVRMIRQRQKRKAVEHFLEA